VDAEFSALKTLSFVDLSLISSTSQGRIRYSSAFIYRGWTTGIRFPAGAVSSTASRPAPIDNGVSFFVGKAAGA
jgi:hypothetical protein